MLRKIDCVMTHVDDLAAAETFYTRAFGLTPLWRDESAVGLAMPETDAEIVLHTMDLPSDATIHYLVDDVPAAVTAYLRDGGIIWIPPFGVPIGKCAVLQDPFGNALCIIDLTRGRRSPLGALGG